MKYLKKPWPKFKFDENYKPTDKEAQKSQAREI